MNDDLLNSMLGDMLDGNESSDEGKSSAADGLADLLGGLAGEHESSDQDQSSGGEMGSLLGSLLGGGDQGGLGEVLGAVLGGGQQGAEGSDLSSILGGLMGGSNDLQADDLSQVPIVGPILERLSQELGIPPNIAMSLVGAVIGMLTSGKLGGGRDLRLDDLANLAEDPSTVQKIAQEVAGETGIDESTVSQAVQHILKMLFQGGM